jgi:diguanylate cyclase (GGDEF)-like protein/PAS domain S-box-containing protein
MSDIEAAAASPSSAGGGRFDSFIDAVDVAILVRSAATGAITDANIRMCEMFGYERGEFLTLGFADLMDGSWSEADALAALLGSARGAGDARLCKAKGGRTFHVDASVREITLGGQDLQVVTARDVTDHEWLLDTELRRSRERLALATECARIGIWDWDLASDRLVWDARMYELYGIRAQDFGGAYGAWLAGVHPEDRASGDAAIAAAISGVRDFDIEFRVVWPNGEVHAIEAHALVQAGADGRAARMIGVNWDITDRRRATETIRLQADQYATMLDTTSDAFWLLDREGRFLSMNDSFCRMTGYSRDELLGLTMLDLEAVEAPEEVVRHMALIEQSGFDRFETRHRRADNSLIDVETCVSFWRDAGRFLCFGRDITDRKRADQALADSEARLKTVLEATADGIAMIDTSSKCFSFVNQSFCTMLGYSSSELAAMGIADVHPPEIIAEVLEHFHLLLSGATRVVPNLALKRKDGCIVFADLSAAPMTLQGRSYLVGCFHDVTARKQAEEQSARMACNDTLTGLRNRHGFVEVLEQTIARARRSGVRFGVLYLDLDHFKDINDTLGHPVGDVVLKAVAGRLLASVRAGDTVARFGGDEFAIILAEIGGASNAAMVSERLLGAICECGLAPAAVAAVVAGVAKKIVRSMNEPISVEGNRVYSGASVGIAVYGADSPDAETVLSHADVALYRAKADHRGNYRFFTAGMDAEVRDRLGIRTDLHEAITSNELFLVYQPQVDIETGRIVGLEALVRWHHPRLGVVGPAKFIPEAERSGLIVPLGRWVLEEACRQTRAWLDAGIAPALIAVNLSAVQFKMPLELEKDIASIVASYGLPPAVLELELTESVLMEASRDYNDVLLRLRKAGHRIAVDDFGSGYSSLDYLRRYPVDRIKIAQTFIADLGVEAGSDAIVRAALGLARELHIEVVVEGVETVAQIGLLKAWGGRIVQGYYFARPLPVAEAAALLRTGTIGSHCPG